MPEAFDPYHKWLSIPPSERPLTHYRLLGLHAFESDPDVIATAADQRMGYIRAYQMGAHSEYAHQLLNEIAAARLCLLKPDRKQQYDAKLRQQLEPSRSPKGIPIGTAIPLAADEDEFALSASAGSLEALTDPGGGLVYNQPLRPLRKRKLNWLPIAGGTAALLVVVVLVSMLIGSRGDSEPEAVIAQQSQEPSPIAAAAPPRVATTTFNNPPPPPRVRSAGLVESTASPAGEPAPEEPIPLNTPVEPEPPRQPVAPPRHQLAFVPRPPGVAPAATPKVKAPPKNLKPVPDEAAQAEAQKIIDGVFADELKALPAGQLELAKKLLAHAKKAQDDQTGRYVLLKMAINLAARGGDAATAMQGVDEIEGTFDIATGSKRADVLAVVVKNATTAGQWSALAVAAKRGVDAAMQADDIVIAARLAPIAASAAKSAKDRVLLSDAAATALELEELSDAFPTLDDALAKLASDTNDAIACRVVGRFRCFYKSQWDDGLPLLANCDDDALREAAAKDLAQPQRQQDELHLADRWWELAESESGRSKYGGQKRAAVWYQKAIASGLAGLVRAKADLRIKAAAEDSRLYREALIARALERYGQDSLDKAASLLHDGLRMLASNKDDDALETLQKAVRLDPESLGPEFIIGTVQACLIKNTQLAEKRFDSCLRRDRTNGAVLNNLALAEFKLGQVSDAIGHWKIALAAGQEPELSQNVGRLLHEVGEKKVVASAPAIEALQKVYDQAVGAGKLPRYRMMSGWLWAANSKIKPILTDETAELLRSVLAQRAGSDALEDKFCSVCRGAGKAACPVRNCSRGTVPSLQRVILGTHPLSGQQLFEDRKVRVRCEGCLGKGTVECRPCFGKGSDPNLY